MNKKIYKFSTILAGIALISVFTSSELESRAVANHADVRNPTGDALFDPILSRSRGAKHIDVRSKGLKAIVVEDFEAATVTTDVNEDGWFVRTTPSPFTGEGTEKKLKQRNPVPALELKMINGTPRDLLVEEWSVTGLGLKNEKVMGVYYRFRYAGFNSVHFIPPREIDWRTREPFLRVSPATGDLVQERGVQLPGRAKYISMWVQGRGHAYNLEVWVKDFRGDVHVLQMGSINFIGWRPMMVKIPDTVPAPPKANPQVNVTRISEIVLRSQTDTPFLREMTSDTYVFFDQIKVLTDDFEVYYDGIDLYKEFENKTQEK